MKKVAIPTHNPSNKVSISWTLPPGSQMVSSGPKQAHLIGPAQESEWEVTKSQKILRSD